MLRDDLARLRKVKGYPAISVLMPRERTKQDAIRLKNLLSEVQERLAADGGLRKHGALLRKLESLAADVNARDHGRGLALFVHKTEAVKLELPLPVEERAIIDDTFATRDIVYALNRSPRYRVLSLAQESTRLFEAVGPSLTEALVDGFPRAHTGPTGKSHKKVPAKGEKVDKREEHLLGFLHEVDKAYAAVAGTEHLPLVVAGVASHLAHFRRVSSRAGDIVAEVAGSFAQATPAKLGAAAWPELQKAMRKRQQQSLETLENAVGAGKYASTLGEVWRAVNEGRVAVLVVEENYREAANADGSPAEDSKAPDVIDDAVDEIIEGVLDRGGRVAFVPDGSLKAHRRIGAILRY